MLCSSPMSMNMLLNMPAWLLGRMGTGIPHCSMYCSRPTVLRQTDLPPALGPDIRRMLFLASRSMSRGTTVLSCLASDSLSSGCMACTQSTTVLRSMMGLQPSKSSVRRALARIKSICAMNAYDSSMEGISGRMESVNAIRMRVTSRRSSASSSRMRLLASTTSSGSMNTVLPDADSSCTIPRILRLSPGATGSTRRPSRMVGAASLST